MRPVALFVTYTMLDPIVGGAFFRALRLARELHRRGWSPVICNSGPMLDDPKVRQAEGIVQFVSLARDAPGFNSRAARRQFESLHPAVVIMGEGPFETMRVFYNGARRVGRPFVVLDQYYNDWLLPETDGVDLVLLYGLKSFWRDDLRLDEPYVLVPPFIETVTPKAELPVPEHLHGHPWVTLIAYESAVLKKGVDLIAGLGEIDAALIIVSHDPGEAMDLLHPCGIAARKTVVLPLQSDANVFGLFAASRVTVVSCGFLQIMEALAMASPVIALQRGSGVGMGSLNIDDRFLPFVSFGEAPARQRERMRRWLASHPFPPDLVERLQHERGGASRCAEYIEALMRRRRTAPGLW